MKEGEQPFTHLFANEAVDLARLRQRAHGLRWASVPANVIPLTAAEPDFCVALPIRESIKRYLDGGVMGYAPPEGLPELRQVAASMLVQRRDVRASPAEIFVTDGVASGMHIVARLALKAEEEAIIFDPVDFLFKAAVDSAGGRAQRCGVDPASGEVDLAALPRLLTPRTRLLCLCNPHNPVGRVFTQAELWRIGTFAVEHDLWIMADEVWSDIVYAPYRHISIAALAPEIAARTFTLMGTSKSFGLSGARVGFIHAPTPALAAQLADIAGARTTAYGVSTLAQAAAVAAFSEGYPWVDAFVSHLARMRDLVIRRLNQLPGVSCRCPEGTYVAFPDVRQLGLSSKELAGYLLGKAYVAVVPGTAQWFGPGAEGHIRICFSTSEQILTEALDRVEQALRDLRR
jgi:aspartate/methionine/tyrosine aminotransferase